MKFVKGILAVIIGAAAYFATFSAFGESWFPYYYHDYISYWFFTGLFALLFFPTLVALFKKVSGPQNNSSSYIYRYYKSALVLNLMVVAASVVIFAYMLSHGVILGGGSGATTFSIAPVQ